jgi:hypothetical protein
MAKRNDLGFENLDLRAHHRDQSDQLFLPRRPLLIAEGQFLITPHQIHAQSSQLLIRRL